MGVATLKTARAAEAGGRQSGAASRAAQVARREGDAGTCYFDREERTPALQCEALPREDIPVAMLRRVDPEDVQAIRQARLSEGRISKELLNTVYRMCMTEEGMGTVLGVSKQWVSVLMGRFGLEPHPRMTDGQTSAAHSLDMSAGMVHDLIGVSPTTYYNNMRRLSLKPKRGRGRSGVHSDAMYIIANDAGLPGPQAAEWLGGVSQATVYKHWRALGLPLHHNSGRPRRLKAEGGKQAPRQAPP